MILSSHLSSQLGEKPTNEAESLALSGGVKAVIDHGLFPSVIEGDSTSALEWRVGYSDALEVVSNIQGA